MTDRRAERAARKGPVVRPRAAVGHGRAVRSVVGRGLAVRELVVRGLLVAGLLLAAAACERATPRAASSAAPEGGAVLAILAEEEAAAGSDAATDAVTDAAAAVGPDAATAELAAAADATVASTIPAPVVPTGAARPAAASGEVTARFISREGRMPHCGILYVVEFMIYEVAITAGDFTAGQRIVVAQGCPEFLQAQFGFKKGAEAFFEPGRRYRLSLSRRFPRTAPHRDPPGPPIGGVTPPVGAAALWAERTVRLP